VSIHRRLAWLEARRPAASCRACGAPDDPSAPVRFHIVTDEPSSPFCRNELPAVDPCPDCGRALAVFTIRIDYAADDDRIGQ